MFLHFCFGAKLGKYKIGMRRQELYRELFTFVYVYVLACY